MTWYEYEPNIAFDAPSGALARNAEGFVYALENPDRTSGARLAIRDLHDTPLASLTSTDMAFIPPFKVDGHKAVVWVSGPYEVALVSVMGVLADADAAQAAAEAAQVAAEDAASRSALPSGGNVGDVVTLTPTGAAYLPPTGGTGGTTIEGAPTVWPSTFPPSSHSHPVDDLRNGTATLATPVVSLLKSLDQAAARAAIGAGTGNGTSNLTLGTSATTAMPGNRVFTATEVTVTPSTNLPQTTVQAALEDVAARAGAGTSGVMVVTYRSGSYPTLPTTKPAGVQLVQFIGPVQATGLPSWIGTGSTQVPSIYDVVATS